jgi:general secretion pathway protein D
VILADARTNSLVVTATPAVLERIQTLLGRLDAETLPAKGVFVYRVEHLRAKELAASLTALFRRRGGEAGEGIRPAPALAFPPGAGPGGARPGGGPPAGGPEGEREDLPAGDIRVIADEATNTLLVTATTATWAALQPVLQRLDRMPRRVLIEILVVEVLLDDSTALGIEWSLRSGNLKIGGERFTLGSGLDTGVPGIAPLPPTFFFILQSNDVLALLQAFSRVNRVNVLSTPHVLASENKKAQIHVGQSVPILTSVQQPTTGVASSQGQPTSVVSTTVEYRDTGIILTVTPRVSDSRFVALDVRQEVSDAIPNLVSSTQSPVITKRVAETSVVVAENETLLLGGLIEERRVRGTEGIPFLSRIPLLGYLLGTNTEAVRKTELLIVVTPRLVSDPLESRSLYEELRRRAPELRRELEPRTPSPALPQPSAPEAPGAGPLPMAPDR